MKITAIAPWFGAKRNLAHEIVKAIGKHRAYWEPFCGSLAVPLAKPPATMETVNDLHGDLINLARCVQVEDTAVELYARLSRHMMHEDLFHEAAERWRAAGHRPASEPPDLERAVDFFVCSWVGRNGVAGTSNYNHGFALRFTKNGGHAATRFTSAVESIPAWHDRLRAMTILNRDGFELLERIEDAEGVAIYCDPPYLTKGAKYVHDFTSTDHNRLAVLLGRFKRTRVVVSYYEHDRLASLYPDWQKLTFDVSKALVSAGGRTQNDVRATEVLLINQRGGLFG